MPFHRPILLLAFIAILASALHAQPDHPPNILWITAEDLSPALGAYGDPDAVTPNLDRLAAEGILFRRAYASAPICAPARSTLITGRYATSLGTQHLRSQIPVPEELNILPEVLQARGYYTTNNSKTDYNFDPEGRWDENGSEAHWRNRPDGQPFFSVFNYGTTHEGGGNQLEDTLPRDLAERHDPDRITLPPYFPDTPEMRRIWARYYDLITIFDMEVGERLRELEEDGLLENTIIFFFGDHGFGMPRYKRWLNHTGLHVPLIVKFPQAYAHLAPSAAGTENTELVSFIDFVPTVLDLAGVTTSDDLPGRAFLGAHPDPAPDYLFFARSRADDVYDVARAVVSEQYIYIRHYLPHQPYVPEALIFGDRKSSFRELNRLHAAGALNPEAEAFYQSRPVEELYDLQTDPHELHTLATSSDHQAVRDRLRDELRTWILEHRDTGFLHEAEYMIRSEGSTPYEMAQDPDQYDLPRILAAAEQMGDTTVPITDLATQLDDPDSGVRFWAATALLARGTEAESASDALHGALDDPSPSVQIVAAEALCKLGTCEPALDRLAHHLEDTERPWVAMYAARTVRTLGTEACPLMPQIQEALETHGGDVWGRYKDWFYSMFTGFALDQAVLNCASPGSSSGEEG